MLEEKLDRLREQATRDGFVPPIQLARAFGWESESLRERSIEMGDAQLDVVRSYAGIQPAALFASAVSISDIPSIDVAALYGYHASVRWGILADRFGLTPFNSHWVARDQWFRLPTIKWDEISQNLGVLEAFQPRQVIEGVPDRIALDRYASPTLLQPVDDELVERLDSWREQALRTSKSEKGVDEQLQTLFAKLFVLRTIEDRKLAESVPALSNALRSPDNIDIGTLVHIFESARTYIGSDLFDNIDLSLLPPHVIAGVISDLYFPKRLGSSTYRYNFSWIDSDVLGLAYEKYLSTVLHPLSPAAQLDFFHGDTRDVDRISVRKAGGVYYTPPYLTKYLAGKCISEFYRNRQPSELPKIIDFACGSGSFLVAALDALLDRLKAVDPSRDWGRELIEGGHIAGVDVDDKAVTVARLNLWNRLAEEPNPLPLPNLSRAVVQGDGLDCETWGDLPRQFDIVLGNPPFLATSRVSNRERLEQRFETAKGRYDFSYLFVEQAISVSSPSGSIGMVVPNRLFKNLNGSAVRAHITARMDLLTIIDFGSNEVFQGTSAYIGCIVARHQELLSSPASLVKVVDVRRLPEQFVAAFLLEAEAGQLQTPDIRVYQAQHPRGPGAWSLLSLEEKRAQIELADLSTRLSEIANIFQGIRTGANDIFILKIESEDERYGAQVSNGLGDSAVLERGLLEPVVFGSEVRRYDTVEYGKYLLYPYENGVPLSEPEMERKYPFCYKYLLSYRDMLANRTSISASGLRWYELVRRRDIEWLRKPKLLIRDLAPETAFAVDPNGGVFIVGGSAVVPETEELLYPLLAYLNSRPVNTLMRRLTPQFRGGFQKFEPQHLQQIPVLNRVIHDADLSDRLARLGSLAADPNVNQGERDRVADEIDEAIASSMVEAGISVAA